MVGTIRFHMQSSGRCSVLPSTVLSSHFLLLVSQLFSPQPRATDTVGFHTSQEIPCLGQTWLLIACVVSTHAVIFTILSIMHLQLEESLPSEVLGPWVWLQQSPQDSISTFWRETQGRTRHHWAETLQYLAWSSVSHGGSRPASLPHKCNNLSEECQGEVNF